MEGNILYTDPAAKKLFTDRTDKEAYRLMMETTLENVRTSDCFQTLGHLDYIVRYGKSGAISPFDGDAFFTSQINESLSPARLS